MVSRTSLTRDIDLLMHLAEAARQAGEPVVSFDPGEGFRNLHNVFRANLSDPALCNAMLLSLSCAVELNPQHPKVLTYKGETIRWMNERMNSPREAASAGTIGTILLLVGIEARAGHQQAVQAHLNGISQIMKLCDEFQVVLHDGIKRSTFWWDCDSSMIVITC